MLLRNIIILQFFIFFLYLIINEFILLNINYVFTLCSLALAIILICIY